MVSAEAFHTENSISGMRRQARKTMGAWCAGPVCVQRNKMEAEIKTTWQPQSGGLKHNEAANPEFLLYHLGSMQ